MILFTSVQKVLRHLRIAVKKQMGIASPEMFVADNAIPVQPAQRLLRHKAVAGHLAVPVVELVRSKPLPCPAEQVVLARGEVDIPESAQAAGAKALSL